MLINYMIVIMYFDFISLTHYLSSLALSHFPDSLFLASLFYLYFFDSFIHSSIGVRVPMKKNVFPFLANNVRRSLGKGWVFISSFPLLFGHVSRPINV